MSEASASKASTSTVETFLTALVTNSGLLAAELAAFVFLKNRLTRIYSPRTYLPPPDKRAADLPSGPWQWLPAIATSPLKDIIHKNGLDAYMFLRFLRLMIIIFASFTFFTWSILIPVVTVGVAGNERDGLSRLSWGNVPADKSERYIAHVVLVYFLTFLVLYLIRFEYMHFVQLREAFLVSKSHSRLPQARTVLITSIPPDMCSEKELRAWASFVPGGVENIWLYRDTKKLNDEFEERLKTCKQLEKAEAKLLRKAVKAQQKQDKRDGKVTSRSAEIDTQETAVSLRSPDLEKGRRTFAEISQAKATLDKLVPPKKRPRHRPGFLGLSRKVDTIEYCKSEILRLNGVIDKLRLSSKDAVPLGSAFIECNLQMGAHVLAQCVAYHEPLMMTHKYIEVAPKDVIWANIDDGAFETRVRYVTSWIASMALIALWFVPVSFVGLLSNVSELCVRIEWLDWVCAAPGPVRGIIQGILPPMFLAILFAVLPKILRALAWYENVPRYSFLSISVYKRYFIFLVVHGFLVVTLSSGITATISKIISSPTQAVSELASHLPDASVFFLTWTITQGLTGAGSALLQVAFLVKHFIKKMFRGRTPREAYEVTFMMPQANFGTVFPRMSLLVTVALVYSILSPIINGLATLAFVLFFFSWKFLLTWVFDQPDERETGGLYFPLAIQNIFVGLYIEQICLAALFFLKISSGVVFLAHGLLMLLLIGITILAQVFLQNSYDPMAHFLPMSIATKQVQARHERQKRKRDHTDGNATEIENEGEDSVDLFSRDHFRSTMRHRISRGVEPSTENISNSSKVAPPGAIPPASPADSDEDEEFDDHGFNPPSTYRDQPWIWVPRDELGISEVLVEDLKLSGVAASDEGSSMDLKGVVEVSRNPPDEAWAGGHDA